MRVHKLLGREVVLQPVLLGAIFADRGWGSWSLTDARAVNVAEIERRAAAYDLPLRWPADWPPNSLVAQRAAIFAQRKGVGRAFAEAAYLATYGAGGDLGEPETLLVAGEAAGLPRDELTAALSDPEIKAALRQATEAAIALGVNGIPTLQIGGQLYFGDDQLEQAARAVSA
jgi:2-hydroxychromene-2-carboxylate isomerase